MNILTCNPDSAKLFETRYVVVYHSHCSDGIFSAASAILGMTLDGYPPRFDPEIISGDAWDALPMITFVEFNYYETLDIDHLLTPTTTLIFVDISLTDIAMLRKVCALSKECISLDHHEDTIEFCIKNIASLPENYRNLNQDTRAGAWLSWDFFCTEQTKPDAVKYADDRDRWVFSLPETKAFHEYVVANVLSKPTMRGRIEAAVYLLDNRRAKEAVAIGRQLIEYRDAIIAPLIKDLHLVDFTHDGKELTAAFITAPYALISESCTQLLSRHSHVNVVCAVYIGSDGTFNYSFRCRGVDEDFIQVNTIAQKFGGGGHKAAAGASNIGVVDFITTFTEKMQ